MVNLLPVSARALPAHTRIASPRFARPSVVAQALLVALALPMAHTAAAATFTISGNSSTAQTLGSGSGQTGTITSTGNLSVGGSTVAITVTGDNATINNQGTVKQTGTGRVIRDNTGVKNLVVNNGSATNSSALMQAADADVIQMNVNKGSVTLNNYGSMISNNASAGGSQAVDFNAITTGTNTINNYATGLMLAYEADGVRPGVNGVVYNAGTIKAITTTGSSSDGVDVQSNTGVQITNDSTGLIEGGRHGITGGAANASVVFTTTITNNAGGVIRGDNGSGINLDGFNALQTATIVNRGSIIGNGVTGDGDGVDVDGPVNLTNYGLIRSQNAFGAPADGLAFSEGVTVGGGTIVNYGTIEGLVAPGNANAVGRGITLAGNDITSGPLTGTREAIYANAVVTNNTGGVIRGQSDSAIVVEGPASGHTVVINNNAGASILGGGATNAAIRTSADNDTLTNAGTINGSSSGKAIDLGGGNNSLYIAGGSASVIGSINGGAGGVNTMTVDAGAGNGFAYGGAISNFSKVEIKSGNTTLSGANAYTGTTMIDSGATLTLDGANRLAAGSSLDLNGGTLKMTDVSGANGQSFAQLLLTGDSTIDLGGTSFTFAGLGDVDAGKTLAVLDFDSAASPAYALRFFGDYTHNLDFLALLHQTTIDGRATAFRFDGTYTDVTAVPEPESIAMLMTGLGLIGALRRKRKTTAA